MPTDANDSYDPWSGWAAPVPVGDIFGDGKVWYKQPQPNNGPGAYVLWTDGGKINRNYDASGKFLNEYKGADSFGVGDLLKGAATVGLGMGLGGLAMAGMGGGAGAAAGAGVNLGTATGADLSAFYGGEALGGGALGGTGAMGAGAGAAAAGAAGGAAGGAGGIGSAITAALGGGGAGGGAGGGLWSSLISGGAQLVGGVLGQGAARDASNAQIAAGDRAIAANEARYQKVLELLAPYLEAGSKGMERYSALSGLNGAQAQAAEIQALQGSPYYTSQVRAGENAILQNAAATGGLRGGNVQGALANFRADTLAKAVDRQLQMYGGPATMGQNSAVGAGNAGLTNGQTVGNILQQQGAAQAGGVLAGNNAITNAIGNIGGLVAQQFAGRAF